MMTDPSSRSKIPISALRSNSARKLHIIVALFVLILFCLLALDSFRIQNLTAIRAYVQGEGLWSKAQKEAVIALRRYGRSFNEVDFRDYLASVAIPLGDRQARIELEKNAPDFDVVYRGFLQGGNRAEDVQGMASLFRRFRKVRYMSKAIDTWTLGDRDIVQLQEAAAALQAEILSGRRDPAAIESLIARIDNIDNHLTPLENQFSNEMTSGSLMLSRYLSLFVFGSAGVLMAAAISFSLHLSGQIQTWEVALEAANESLKKSERRFRFLMRDLSDVILVLASDGTLYYASHSAGRIFGYSPSDLTGQNVSSFIHKDDRLHFKNCLEKVATQVGGSFATEFRLLRKDGSWISVEATGNPMSDDPSAGRTLLTCRDVTERRRLENELGQSQKMEAIGRLAGGIAHDFNNILMIIGGYAEIILGQLHPQDPLRKSADPILNVVDRGAALTKRLLSFSRKQVMNPRNLDPNAILEDISKILPRLLGEEIEMAVLPGRDTGMIYADHIQLEQVLINLAVNARDAMPHGGRLTIETANIDFDGSHPPPQQLILPGSYVLLKITDTGCGMNSETRSHVFEPFFTTKAEGKGTGLGLSIVYGIVKRSGGYILVESELNSGTTIKIYFPRVDAVPSPPVDSASQVVNAGNDSGIVLIVEDEELLRNMICEFLASGGYTVLEASSGAEAIAAMERFGRPIDILVTDVILPKTRGPELAGKLREKLPDLKVIYMSGYTDTSLVRDGILEAGTILVQKPFKLQELARVIREALSRVQR
jgi:PAS domain S-box-containing protein